MAKHSAPREQHPALKAMTWAREHKSQILALALVLLPIVSRLVPAFPTAEVMAALHTILGA